MGGWVILFGSKDGLKSRIERFKGTFEIQDFTKLYLQVVVHTEEFVSLCWSWREGEIPDVSIFKNTEKDCLLLCGAITEVNTLGQNGVLISNSDIMKLWKQHGESLISHLNGSWSFLFFDHKRENVSIFVDRFASRSVWVSRDNGVWIIGNFPSSIATLRENPTNLDGASLFSLFHSTRHIPGRGLYKEIFPLSAGEKITLERNGQYQLSKWWRREYQPACGVSNKEWGHRLASALRRSAENMKKTTSDPHLFLSGGLDSRIAAAATGRPLKAITLCNLPNMETKCATLVAKAIDIEHQVIIRSPYWYLDSLNAAALISSGNNLYTHAHFINPVMEIGRHSKSSCFLLGDLLENLNKHYFAVQPKTCFRFSESEVISFLRNNVPGVNKNPPRLLNLFQEGIRKRLIQNWEDAVRESAKLVMDVSDDDGDKADTYLRWFDVSVTYTFNMISCIWPFAGERNIFLDNELNDLLLKIPSEIRGKGVIHPWILWNLNKLLLLIPNANNFLPVFAPKILQELAREIRPKMGLLRRGILSKFKSGPLKETSGSWPLTFDLYRKDKRYSNRIDILLRDEAAFPEEIFDLNEIKNTWESFIVGDTERILEINALITFGSLNQQIPAHGIAW